MEPNLSGENEGIAELKLNGRFNGTKGVREWKKRSFYSQNMILELKTSEAENRT
jgi:hypothetical protein